MSSWRVLAACCALAAAAWPLQRNKKEKEEPTQVLELPRDLPGAVAADRARLFFYVSPLSARGLLSQQVRDALHMVLQAPNSAACVKLRAFVSGTGDMRRVRDLVSETFAERHRPLPVVSIAQVGALPLTGAQVVFEATNLARKETNGGLAFIAGQPVTSGQPLDPVLPLAERAAENLKKAVSAAGAAPADVMRLTCFFSSLDDFARVRALFDAAYPAAARNYVQFQRASPRATAACEAVARLTQPPGAPLTVLDQEDSRIALVGAPQVVVSGAQSAFGSREADARLAFERLEKTIQGPGGTLKRAAFAGFYPLSSGIAAAALKIGMSYFDAARPPAATVLPFEGLPSMDAAFAVDVVAVKDQ